VCVCLCVCVVFVCFRINVRVTVCNRFSRFSELRFFLFTATAAVACEHSYEYSKITLLVIRFLE